MLPSMIQQITAASLPRPAERANTRKLRQENILMMMLGRNLTALDMSRHYKKSLSMIANDLREMIDDQYVFAFSPSGAVTAPACTASQKPVLSERNGSRR